MNAWKASKSSRVSLNQHMRQKARKGRRTRTSEKARVVAAPRRPRSPLYRRPQSRSLTLWGMTMEALLAKEIKAFRKQFHRHHGRDPSSKDMAKVPEMKATYDAWLALKSNSTASTSADADVKGRGVSSKPSSKLKRMGKQTKNQSESEMESAHVQSPPSMPPPSTPQKKEKARQSHYLATTPSAIKTPKGRRSTSNDIQDDEVLATVHDSGGSIVDVPTTPVLQQGRHAALRSAQSPGSPSMHSPSLRAAGGRRSTSDFDDGTSPSKLRSLIASFSTSRAHVTPTKKAVSQTAPDDKRGGHLRASRSDRAEESAMIQNGSLFTPRTKARKRLRGEIVVTPAKSKTNSSADLTQQDDTNDEQSLGTTSTSIRPSKRQRAAGTLREFDFIPIDRARYGSGAHRTLSMSALKQNREVHTQPVRTTSHHFRRDHDGADTTQIEADADILGPSPSVRKMIDMPIGSFRPLFSADAAGADNDREEASEDEDMNEDDPSEAEIGLRSSQTAANEFSSTAITTPTLAAEDANGSDSDEEERMLIRTYARHGHSPDLSRDEEAEEGAPFGDTLLLRNRRTQNGVSEVALAERKPVSGDEEGGGDMAFSRLSLGSPQMKRAQRLQRRMHAQSVRKLLLPAGNAGLLDENENESAKLGESKKGSEVKPIAHGARGAPVKTARMMRGTLTKAGRKAMALAEQKQGGAGKDSDVAEEDERKKSAARDAGPPTAKLILRRGREEEEDEIEEDENLSDIDEALDAHGVHSDRDDEWASDVDSDEYGLGDGYMEETDVM